MKNIEGHFWLPSHPIRPDPIRSHQTRASRSILKMLSRWTPEGHCRYGAKISRGCQNCALYVWTFRPKNKKVTYLLWFWKFLPPPPTWHQIFKPIRMLVTIFISYISRYIHNLYIYLQSMKKIEAHFSWPSVPPVRPVQPVQPVPSNSRFALDFVDAESLDPGGTL